MAIGASTVWRVRISGNDTNGAGFDSTIASAGTDYSQQDSPQLSVTDAVGNGTTTLTSATGGFTSAMIGNAIRISAGTGATTGYYFITARTDTNTVTIDRSPGTGTGWTAKVGGGAATIARIFTNGNATGDKVVAGNTIYVRGSGTNNPTSADYTYTANLSTVSGTQTAKILVIGENGRPRFDGSGIDSFMYIGASVVLRGLYVKSGTASAGYVINLVGNYCSIENCVVHLNDINTNGVICSGQNFLVEGNEFLSHATAPTARSGKYALGLSGTAGTVIGNTFYRCGGDAIYCTPPTACIVNNLITLGKQNGINLSSNYYGCSIIGNTIDQNDLDGIKIATSSALETCYIANNLITNHSAVGKYGINVAAGTATDNDKFKREEYNAFYNNTTNVNGITLSSTDLALSANPYTQSSPPTTNWAVDTTVKALGFPGAFPGGVSGVASTSYLDIGGVQREEAGSGSGGGSLILGGLGQTGIGTF